MNYGELAEQARAVQYESLFDFAARRALREDDLDEQLARELARYLEGQQAGWRHYDAAANAFYYEQNFERALGEITEASMQLAHERVMRLYDEIRAEQDKLEHMMEALRDGDWSRAETLSRELVERFPRYERAQRGGVLAAVGERIDEAQGTLDEHLQKVGEGGADSAAVKHVADVMSLRGQVQATVQGGLVDGLVGTQGDALPRRLDALASNANVLLGVLAASTIDTYRARIDEQRDEDAQAALQHTVGLLKAHHLTDYSLSWEALKRVTVMLEDTVSGRQKNFFDGLEQEANLSAARLLHRYEVSTRAVLEEAEEIVRHGSEPAQRDWALVLTRLEPVIATFPNRRQFHELRDRLLRNENGLQSARQTIEAARTAKKQRPRFALRQLRKHQGLFNEKEFATLEAQLKRLLAARWRRRLLWLFGGLGLIFLIAYLATS